MKQSSPPRAVSPAAPAEPSAFPLFKKALSALGLALCVLSVAGLDLFSRARSAVLRAETFERLARNPAEREAYLQKSFLDGIAALDRRRPSGAEREIEVEILRKRWEESRLRCPWTDAYRSWRDVYALYSPPETGWSRGARLMAPAARQRWREEWKSRGLPFDDSLLELEPGESDGWRLVFSTPSRREMGQAQALLESVEVTGRVSPPGAPSVSANRDLRLLVPEERFWDAHQALLPLVGGEGN